MKKTLYLAIALLLYTACKKDDPDPTTGSSRSMNATETSLVGDWMLDTSKMYVNGTVAQTTYHNDPINCHLNLTSTPHPATLNSYEAIAGLHCVNGMASWYASPTTLTMDVIYQIETLTSTNLVIMHGSESASGWRYYLHK